MIPKIHLLDQIGNTPLIRIESVAANLPDIEIWAKLEFFNPGGSVKDRPALNIIQEGERSGRLTQGKPFWTPPAATPASPTP